MTDQQPVSPEECPDSSVHGNPFRYCPTCTWTELDEEPAVETQPQEPDPAPAERPQRIKASNPPKPATFVNHRVKATRPVAE